MHSSEKHLYIATVSTLHDDSIQLCSFKLTIICNKLCLWLFMNTVIIVIPKLMSFGIVNLKEYNCIESSCSVDTVYTDAFQKNALNAAKNYVELFQEVF